MTRRNIMCVCQAGEYEGAAEKTRETDWRDGKEIKKRKDIGHRVKKKSSTGGLLLRFLSMM